MKAGANHNDAASAYAYPAADVQKWTAEAMKDQESTAPEKLVFLTFDDGPNDTTSVEILDILKKHGVPATFFVVGKLVESGAATLKREVSEGHAIAMHSYTHDYNKLYPGRVANTEAILGEYRKTKKALENVLGSGFKTGAWRYPGGHLSWKRLDDADAALKKEGVHWIDWDALTGDAEPKSRRPTTVEGMVKVSTGPIRRGVKATVLLAHDSQGKDLTVKSLPQIIKEYKDAGYKFGVIA